MSAPKESPPKESYNLACPFPLQNQKHYQGAQTSNCTTHKGFANRQLLRQHIISEHLALCPKCFELKKAEGKTPEDSKKAPDKKIETVLAWRKKHLLSCRPVGGVQGPPSGRYPLTNAQTEAFAALDHKALVRGAVRDPKEYEFKWWEEVFKALYPSVSDIPLPNTRYYIPLPDFEKAVRDAVEKELASRRQEQPSLKTTEIIVHAVKTGQIGLPPGVDPDPWKYQQLDPHIFKNMSRKFDMVKPGVLNNTPSFGQPISDSGYGSHPGDSLSVSPPWPTMDLDEEGPETRHDDFSYLGRGAGSLVRGDGDFIADLNYEMRHYRQ